jgi:uncharacterized protein (TIGR03382 family)
MSRARARWRALALIAGTVLVLRAPSLAIPILNEDEALYATTAAGMAAGQPPYRAGVESKPPGIFYLYEAAFAIVGRYDMRALHALTMLWVLGTALVVGAIARRAAPKPEPDPEPAPEPALDEPGEPADPPERVLSVATIASLLYVAFTIVEEPAVMASQCELLYSLPLSIAAWLVIRGATGRTTGSGRWLAGCAAIALAGLACGAGTLIKPTAISLPVAASAWLVVRRRLLGGPDPFAVDLARAAALWAGFAAAWLAAWAYFAHLGVWDDLIYWAFRWTLGTYIPTGTSHSPFLMRFAAGFCVWFGLTTILWLLGAVAVRTASRRADRVASSSVAWVQVTGLLVAWALAATALTFLGGRFFDHYFPAVIPPLAALAAVGAGEMRARRRWRRAIALGAALPTLACWAGTCQFDRTTSWFGEAPRPYDQIAGYLHDHTAETDRVFVWGYFPLIYVAADRLAATRYVGCHYITGYAAIGLGRDLPPELEDRLGVPGGFAILLGDLETYHPALIVDTAPADLHHWRRYPLSRYPVLADYVSAHYVREADVQGAVIYRRR